MIPGKISPVTCRLSRVEGSIIFHLPDLREERDREIEEREEGRLIFKFHPFTFSNSRSLVSKNFLFLSQLSLRGIIIIENLTSLTKRKDRFFRVAFVSRAIPSYIFSTF